MKVFINEEFVLINLDTNIFKFCHIEVSVIKKDLYIVKVRQGKLGGSGKFTTKEFNNYDECLLFVKSKQSLLIEEGFIKKETVRKLLTKDRINKKQSSSTIEMDAKFYCANCNVNLSKPVFDSIAAWGKRNWANSPLGDYSKKVICIDCQKKLGFYKVKF